MLVYLKEFYWLLELFDIIGSSAPEVARAHVLHLSGREMAYYGPATGFSLGGAA